MNLRQLEYFKQIAQLRSLTRAAHVLHITQPTLTRQMHQLEKELKVLLFTRSDKGVMLTPAGLELLERANTLLGQVKRIGAAGFRQHCKSQAGRIHRHLQHRAGGQALARCTDGSQDHSAGSGAQKVSASAVQRSHRRHPPSACEMFSRPPPEQRALAGGDWLRHGHHMLRTGATTCGKTWLACALGQQAARLGHGFHAHRGQHFMCKKTVSPSLSC
jgi:DNA-binding transcriptional LysR family regulator